VDEAEKLQHHRGMQVLVVGIKILRQPRANIKVLVSSAFAVPSPSKAQEIVE
jgi:hypothetical protein